MPEDDLPEIRFAEHPERSCRVPVSEDGMIDHFCALPEEHLGPHCPRSLQPAIERRQAWEHDNPGWERMGGSADPFAGIEQIAEGR
jgi:hypothetical protein